MAVFTREQKEAQIKAWNTALIKCAAGQEYTIQTASRMEMRLVFMKSPFASPEATSAPIATGGVTAESSP